MLFVIKNSRVAALIYEIQVTSKNADGETPLDLAPPKLAARLVRDLNTILASWKGPVPYPNPGMGDELAATEGQQRRKVRMKTTGKGEWLQ